METKFSICDKAVFLNTGTGKFEKVEIKGIQVIPLGMHRDESGENVLDGYEVLYQTVEGVVLAEKELFGSEEEARSTWLARLQ